VFLRKLTDKELEQIKKAKAGIKEQRQSLQGAVKKQRKSIQEETKRLKGKAQDADILQNLEEYGLNALRDNLTTLQNQFNALPIITGLPVIVRIGEESLRMNYELLNKFDRLLDKSNLSVQRIKIDGRSLIVRYGKYGQSGSLELLEPVEYLVDPLTWLPAIDL